MAIKQKDRNAGRQWPLVASQTITYDQLEPGVGVEALVLPGGARVIGGFVVVEQAFSAGALNVGNATTAAKYASAVNLTATGRTALTLSGAALAAPEAVLATLSVAATSGRMTLVIEYIIDGRSNEVQPTD